jgi:hypothetical protein
MDHLQALRRQAYSHINVRKVDLRRPKDTVPEEQLAATTEQEHQQTEQEV